MYMAETVDKKHTVLAVSSDKPDCVMLEVHEGTLPHIGAETVAELEFDQDEVRDLIFSLAVASGLNVHLERPRA